MNCLLRKICTFCCCYLISIVRILYHVVIIPNAVQHCYFFLVRFCSIWFPFMVWGVGMCVCVLEENVCLFTISKNISIFVYILCIWIKISALKISWECWLFCLCLWFLENDTPQSRFVSFIISLSLGQSIGCVPFRSKFEHSKNIHQCFHRRFYLFLLLLVVLFVCLFKCLVFPSFHLKACRRFCVR